MVTSRKISKPKPQFLHSCSQVDKIQAMEIAIDEIRKVITGNGEPEKGLIGQMIIQNQIQKRTVETLDRLETKLDKSDIKVEVIEKLSIQTANDLNLYKEQGKNFRAGKEFAQTSTQNNKITGWDKIRTWAMVISVLTVIILGILNLKRNSNIQKEVEEVSTNNPAK